MPTSEKVYQTAAKSQNTTFTAVVLAHQAKGRRIILPEIIDYEIRREFELNGMYQSMAILDALPRRIEYLTITTSMMIRASKLWARARRIGRPTASKAALDIDMILIAQSESTSSNFIIATSNVAHLSRFVPADLWQNIVP